MLAMYFVFRFLEIVDGRIANRKWRDFPRQKRKLTYNLDIYLAISRINFLKMTPIFKFFGTLKYMRSGYKWYLVRIAGMKIIINTQWSCIKAVWKWLLLRYQIRTLHNLLRRPSPYNAVIFNPRSNGVDL